MHASSCKAGNNSIKVDQTDYWNFHISPNIHWASSQIVSFDNTSWHFSWIYLSSYSGQNKLLSAPKEVQNFPENSDRNTLVQKSFGPPVVSFIYYFDNLYYLVLYIGPKIQNRSSEEFSIWLWIPNLEF